jgi:hypothetical protein
MNEMRGISERQNSAQSMMLLRAVAVSHLHAQRAQTAALIVSLAVAALSLVTTGSPAAARWVTLAGAVWAAGYAIAVVPWTARNLATSATLQEMFDTALFRLPWNAVAVGEPVPDDEVARLGHRFRGDESELRDYYVVANVPAPFDVLFCVEQNLVWGPRVRRRYANLILGFVVLWSALGVVVGMATGSSLNAVVAQWFIPSLGLLLFCLDVYRAQLADGAQRARLLALVRARARQKPAAQRAGSDLVFLRRVQDVLFQLRKRPRVPNWFFRLQHETDLADFAAVKTALEERFRPRVRRAS